MIRNVLLLFTLLLPEIARADCWAATDVGIWGSSHPVSRLNGNAVRAYSETYLTGSYAGYWYSAVSSWMYRNSVQIGSYAEAQAATPATAISQTYTPSLSVYGPGSYQQKAYHRAYSPYCGWVAITQNGGYTYGPALAVERPTVTMDHPIWYLGGVGGFGSYQITGVLTANANGATETPVWTVTTGGTKVNLGCTNFTWTYITALAASSGCTYDVTLQASVGGFPSDIFFIYITGTTITLTQAVAQSIGVITIQ